MRKLVLILASLCLVANLLVAAYLIMPSLESGSSEIDWPSDGIHPLEIPSPMPSAPPDPLEEQQLAIERQLRDIPARYNVPDYLLYGRSTEISFVLEPQGVGSGADRLVGMSGNIVTTKVQISPQAKARLTGPADLVRIQSRDGNNEQYKAVTSAAPVQWVWDVTAIGQGTAVLQLDLIAFVRLEDPAGQGNYKDLQINTFRRQIPIMIPGADRVRIFVADTASIIGPIWAFVGAAASALIAILAYFGWSPSFKRSHGDGEEGA
jgi:hypothetical protein